MIRLSNKILNYCGLCRYVKAIKPNKVVRKSLFKKKFKVQTWSNAGTNNRKLLENIFTQNLIYERIL